MTQPAGEFALRIERIEGYEFKIAFDNPRLGGLIVDEPPPLGREQGPNPARMLAAAIGSCLSASLVFCLSRAKQQVSGMTSEVRVQLVRNERKRLRVGRVDVLLSPELESDEALSSCLDAFEDFCVVTQSVRDGLDVRVHVEPKTGAQRMHRPGEATESMG